MANGRQALIRTATTLFARDGIGATSLRTIAAAAGTSPALVRHHFGSLTGLRRAVDREVADLILRTYAAEEPTLEGRSRATAALMRSRTEVLDYLARALSEEGEATTRLFETLVATGREDLKQLQRAGSVAEDADAEWYVLHHILLILGPFLIRPHVEAALGERLFDEQSFERWKAANERLLRSGWYENGG